MSFMKNVIIYKNKNIQKYSASHFIRYLDAALWLITYIRFAPLST